MTEPVLSEEMNRRAKVFQFDPTPSPLRPGSPKFIVEKVLLHI